MGQPHSLLRTRIYVDGYNLYYGCLRRTRYRWLDVNAVFTQILSTVFIEKKGMPITWALDPLCLKYFTAPILKNFARSNDSVSSQSRYHDALRGHLGGSIQIVEGYYDAKPAKAHLYKQGQKARDSEVREIWKLEEKQSDVALALHAYSDVIRGQIDHAVIVTNDTDLAPALEMIRAHTSATIGLIIPTRDKERPANTDLSCHSHWTRSHILDRELLDAQMPAMVRHNSIAIQKPISWYPRPDLLEPILVEAKRVKKSHGAAMKWLNQPSPRLGGRIPIEMAETESGADELRAYMEQYAKDFGI
jgi:6-hydroxy-3-succinoylpyridine 3-monooxygenase